MSTARALQNDLQQATGRNISDQTIENRHFEGGLRAQHPLVVRCALLGTVDLDWTQELSGLPLVPCAFHR